MNNVEISDAVIEELVRLQNTPISSFEIENEELKLLLHNYCIHKQQTLNGKAASEPVEKFLLNIEKNGEAKRQMFISECESDISRFEKSIQRTPQENFALDYSKKNKTKVGGTGNNQRYINLTKVYEHLGPSLSRSLPGFHALTGCDFNPAFFKRDEAASNGNITDDDEDDDSSGQYRNWQNDENSNDLVDEYDE
ncbi:hypothetical protein EVAR_28594_1 [Eumeta japonica]|uniref:Uncharacterized protein n=1 Tax=Eumeta variegata TaxID=151549 RepID=A0A4C1UWT8_EUMVA|nr:hypothetical protein EVAR_28594_1 [Eumeta japonica]